MDTKKYLGFRKLTSHLHFHTAMIERTVILAFQDAELIGSGRIEALNEGEEEDVVVIGGENYTKRNCTFVYAR
ncbi:hypothetical protein PghCCS26_47680 [Paenibacillus glycanilyticus]|uniref:Uncharacterized protein n=1 Tax=Paenibacillus glycanilyticus TaxID=126569 RepID=A0ABQ6NRC6_9BACL|nr:hypothetical protein [Paenibacillus glycanilyticus]GMK47638.1 hypothetical protein PghCCS26_47680 [Paenibacillus glycanilyticus]